MKRTTRALSILAALCLAANVLSACGGKEPPISQPSSAGGTAAPESSSAPAPKFNETGFPIVNEPITQKLTIAVNPSYKVEDMSEMWFFKKMEEKTNVRFEFERLSTDQWEERKNLMFASNELPDILAGGLSNNDIITYSKAKQIIPVGGLAEKYAPDYLACLDQFEESAKLYAPDGELYGLTFFTGGYAEVPGSRAFINTQWLDNLGLKHPETWDEFYDVLVAFRDQDPDGNGQNDTIPLCGYSSGYAVDPFVAGPLGMSFGWAQKDKWQVVGDKLVYVAEHPNYEQYLANMNKLYSEKLLDQEYYTQNDAQYTAKGTNMLIGACTCAAPFVVTGSTDPAIYEQYDVIGPMTSNVFTEKKWYGTNVNGLGLFLTSANKNPEISLRYFNELYTEDGAWLLVGPEKGEWEQYPEEGRVWNADKSQYTYEYPDSYNGTFVWMNEKVAPLATAPFHGYRQFTDAMKDEAMKPEDVVLLNSLKKNLQYMEPNSPTLFFTPEELEEIKLIEASLYTYCEQMEAKIVMGEEPLSASDAMISELKNQGLDKLTEVYNAAYGRYKSNMK